MTTPRYGHPPIGMRRIKDSEHPDPDDLVRGVGDFWWRFDDAGRRTLVVAIPHSNRSGWVYSEWTIDHANDCGASWSWDGNEQSPTLNPSLHAVGVWHGWVRAGQLVEA